MCSAGAALSSPILVSRDKISSTRVWAVSWSHSSLKEQVASMQTGEHLPALLQDSLVGGPEWNLERCICSVSQRAMAESSS